MDGFDHCFIDPPAASCALFCLVCSSQYYAMLTMYMLIYSEYTYVCVCSTEANGQGAHTVYSTECPMYTGTHSCTRITNM